MRLYVDEDLVARHLIQALRKASHDVVTPSDVGLLGRSDTVQLTHAVREGRICVTRNATDYEDLHNLILTSGGSHPGIFTVRMDNDSRRDMKPGHIVRALKNISEILASLGNHIICLNDWR
jgi:predicted nuclease of predicted toxin-antitoxin system